MSGPVFRDLAEDDLALLFNWLDRPHVRRWYSNAPTSFAEIAAKYRPRTLPDSPVKAFIVQSDGADVGYVQGYFIDAFPDYEQLTGCEKGVAGVDLFIADEWRTRHGLGSRVVRRFVDDIIFGMYGASACVAGPNEGNTGAIRAFAKAGFRPWKVVANERGEREALMRMERDTVGYRVAAIDPADEATCARFHREMYLVAFGTDEGLEEEMGPGEARYLQQLRDRIAAWPEGNVHAWHGDAIVGQLEMRLLDNEPHVGYVSLVFVEPAHRAQGLGRLLVEHAVQAARARDMRLLRLSVALTNVPAMMFYKRLGWHVVGSRPNVQPMAIMELDIA